MSYRTVGALDVVFGGDLVFAGFLGTFGGRSSSLI
jgi:hypothetical protein